MALSVKFLIPFVCMHPDTSDLGSFLLCLLRSVGHSQQCLEQGATPEHAGPSMFSLVYALLQLIGTSTCRLVFLRHFAECLWFVIAVRSHRVWDMAIYPGVGFENGNPEVLNTSQEGQC